MKVAILGNMANNGYNTAKALRAAGHEVDLFITSIALNAVSSVEWEEGVIGPGVSIDSTNNSLIAESRTWKRPEWVHYFDMQLVSKGRLGLSKIADASRFFDLLNSYDLVELHVPYPIVSPFLHVPKTIYEAGWARDFPRGNSFYDYLAARGYAKADRILVTNVDMWRIFDSLKFVRTDNVQYMPFSIDTEKYAPLNLKHENSHSERENDIVLLQPSRQHWVDKGNHKVFRALAELIKLNAKVKLWVAEWGADVGKSKELAERLGISKNLVWFKPVAKPTLVRYINNADIILDQFPDPSAERQLWGAWGTAALEAMSCAKPLLMFYDTEGVDRFIDERPPAFNCLTASDILQNLQMLVADNALRSHTGAKSRDWVIRHHGHQAIAHRYLELFESLNIVGS